MSNNFVEMTKYKIFISVDLVSLFKLLGRTSLENISRYEKKKPFYLLVHKFHLLHSLIIYRHYDNKVRCSTTQAIKQHLVFSYLCAVVLHLQQTGSQKVDNPNRGDIRHWLNIRKNHHVFIKRAKHDPKVKAIFSKRSEKRTDNKE